MIGQDAYFIGPKPQSYWTQAPKESPDTVEMPALRTAVRAASEDAATDVVLVEGFLLLQDAPIMSCVDAVLFLTSDPTTCLARRLARSVRTPHESEGLRVYYKKHVWPGYLKHTQPAIAALREAVAAGVPGKPRLCEIDGTQSLEADELSAEYGDALRELERLAAACDEAAATRAPLATLCGMVAPALLPEVVWWLREQCAARRALAA